MDTGHIKFRDAKIQAFMKMFLIAMFCKTVLR